MTNPFANSLNKKALMFAPCPTFFQSNDLLGTWRPVIRKKHNTFRRPRFFVIYSVPNLLFVGHTAIIPPFEFFSTCKLVACYLFRAQPTAKAQLRDARPTCFLRILNATTCGLCCFNQQLLPYDTCHSTVTGSWYEAHRSCFESMPI
ncbi:MAG: hypothetical protein CL609_07740 [Anaerolineaceae bacterium]|nr:hypothetical protein [Anaerolineaceae bacterium]